MSENENEFLARVEAVTNQVQGLLANKISVDAVDTFINKQSAVADLKRKEKDEKVENLRLCGRPGAGNSEDYAFFCRRCFTEFPEKIDKCGRCGNACLISRDERRGELLAKVNRMREEQALRKIRKDRFDKFLKTSETLRSSTAGGTDFERWSLFEASDSEEEQPVLPRHDPQFRAMEKDMEERGERRKRAAKKAEELKLEGNRKFAAGNFLGAYEAYKEGLEHDRGQKELLGNLSLVEFKLGKFSDAISSATKVLDICELFEGGFENSPKICAKAFLRRANANRELKNFQAARADLEAALRLQPDDAELKKHLEICDELISESATTNQPGLSQPELESRLMKLEISDQDIDQVRKSKALQIFFLKNALAILLEEMRSVAVHAKNPEISDHPKISAFIKPLKLLDAVVAESDAAAALLLAHAYILIDLTPNAGLRPLAISVLARISVSPTAQAELRRLYLKPTVAKQRLFLTSDASIDGMGLLTNVLFGASDAEKSIFRKPEVFQTIARHLRTADWYLVQKAASLACNLGDDQNSELIADCVITLAKIHNRSNLQISALDQLLNALHNAVVVSEAARKSLLPKSNDLARTFAQLSVDKRSLTILLKLGQTGAELSDESEAVCLARTALSNSDQGCQDAAVRLIAYAYQKDSSIMTAPLVEKLIDLLVAIKPKEYAKSATQLTPEGLLRANVCLLLGHAADRQAMGGLADVNLTRAIEPVIQTLRMDAESVQKNAGVALTKIARIDKYKETVRELRGFESLGQIQLKLIQKP